MQRGIISLTNLELSALYNLALSQGCKDKDLVAKLAPVEESNHPPSGDQNTPQEYNVLISEDEAEIMLDCMPMPSDENDPNLVSARIKIQQFIAKSRFGEEDVTSP